MTETREPRVLSVPKTIDPKHACYSSYFDMDALLSPKKDPSSGDHDPMDPEDQDKRDRKKRDLLPLCCAGRD